MTRKPKPLTLAEARRGYYRCTNCDNIEFKEREVVCWVCGKGEMLWRPDSGHSVGVEDFEREAEGKKR